MKKLIISICIFVLLFVPDVLSQSHFTKVWDGNGIDHMNFYITSGSNEEVQLDINDEVAVFDGDICVGLTKLTKYYAPGEYISIETSKDDDVTPSVIDGYTPGNTYSVQVWDDSESSLIESLVDTLFAGDDLFVVGGAATLVLEQALPTPTLDPLPAITGECSIVVNTFPTATGYFGDDIVATTNSSLSYSEVGEYQILWNYEDDRGNQITQTQTVKIIDTIAPVFRLDTLPLISNRCFVEVNEIPMAIDACEDTIYATTQDSLSYHETGEYLITWRFNDGNGNISTQLQAVEVTDYTPPIEVSADTTIFPGQSIILYAYGGDSYSWSNGEDQQYTNVTPFCDTSFVVTVIKDGCTAKDTVNISMKPTPDIALTKIVPNKTEYKPGDSIKVNWTVKNIGAVQALGGWTGRVGLCSDLSEMQYLRGILQYDGTLQANDSVMQKLYCIIPDDLPLSGDIDVAVELTSNAGLFERPEDTDNNKSLAENKITIANTLSLTIPGQSFDESYSDNIRCLITRNGTREGELPVTLNLSSNTDITMPDEVTIPIGSASVLFYMNINDNNTIEGNRSINITASANGFIDAISVVEVTDNETPSLSLVINDSTVYEGDTINAIITRDLVTDEDLAVNISADISSQIEFQIKDTIPANESTSNIQLIITDDDLPELDNEIVLSVNANGFNSGKDTVTVIDNDIPGIEFEILTDTISESSGLFAAWAVIRRTVDDGTSIRVSLTPDRSDAIFIPSVVDLSSTEPEKKINFGAYDNNTVDSFRAVAITASVYINSCNCNTTTQNGGFVSDTITIADDDGPALSCSFKTSALPEGTVNTNSFTIHRNTLTDQALTVTLTSSDTSEISIPETVVIPSGMDQASIDIETYDDGIMDGEQIVTIHANHEGFSPGSAWVIVTDDNISDLQVSDLSIGNDTAVVVGQLDVTANIVNKGSLMVPEGTRLQMFLSQNTIIDDNDLLLKELIIQEAIEIGDTVTISANTIMPTKTGNYYVIAKVNPYKEVDEILYNNNQSNPLQVALIPSYNGTAQTDEEILSENKPVEIYGQALYRNGSAAPNKELDVYILNSGTRRTLSVITDENGNYRTTFTPNPNEAGHYMIGACYPKQGLIDVNDEFDIPGIRRVNNEFIIWDVKLNIPETGSIQIQNLSNIPLTNLKLTPVKVPEGLQININPISEIDGYGTASFNYTIEGKKLTEGFDYTPFEIMLDCDEGISKKFKIYYFCQAPTGQLKSLPLAINTNITKGYSKSYEVIIYNDGAGETGKISIDIPDVNWMKLASKDTIESLAPGEQASIQLEFLPGDDVPLNTPISGNIAVNIANGHGVSIPYRIEVTSEAKGSLTVDVLDEHSYYAEGLPHVKDAHVTVRHPFSGEIVAEGVTDKDGKFIVDNIAEGSYRISVNAERHESYQNIVEIVPGKNNEQEVFISFQAITYTWEVVPTEIEDRYEVELVMKYETNVPVPVVVIEMPKEMPQLAGTETYPFFVTVTNKGLITAEEVSLEFPDDPEYEFITNYDVMDIWAQQSIQVPVVMRRKDAYANLKSVNSLSNYGKPIDIENRLKAATTTNADTELNCKEYLKTIYGWQCGQDKRWHRSFVGYTFKYRVCDTAENRDDVNPGTSSPHHVEYSSSGEGETNNNNGNNNSSGNSDDSDDTYEPRRPHPVFEAIVVSSALATVATSEIMQGCDPCVTSIFLAAGSCIPIIGNAYNVVSCVTSTSDGIEWYEPLICGGSFIEGPVGCAFSLFGAGITCYNDPPDEIGTQTQLKSISSSGGKMPPILRQAMIDMNYCRYAAEGMNEWFDEIVGGTIEWQYKNSFDDFVQLTDPFLSHNQLIETSDANEIIAQMEGNDISTSEINAFISRWNTTATARNQGIYSPNTEYPNIIDIETLNVSAEKQDSAMRYAESRGYTSLSEMYNEAVNTTQTYLEESKESVCASVTISIKQKVTMTREAFEGTLTISNGHFADPMRDIQLILDIRNEQGEPANDLFQIETKSLDVLTGIEGDGILNAGKKGSVTILFIPEKSAAPKVPLSYSFGGSFSYIDPFTGTTVTRELFPVTLEVNPSPDLHLHYFMQRNVFGDDPLTEGIEPSIPAELALMIENEGYGTARNVLVESAQPEIIENEKGLAIHFELIGSCLQGDTVNLGLNNINFGQIDSLSAKIGQWWMTCDLLGHFINYETNVTHLDSRGNPDLSLINGATLHELVKSIIVYGDKNDSISDFLVNEIQDIKEMPDAIYLSQGNEVIDVFEAVSGNFTGEIQAPDFTNQLSVIPSHSGWHYIQIDDPGNGDMEIVSITRNEDGQKIPVTNGWLTQVSLPDSNEPVYENKFHFVDEFADDQEQTYTIIWKEKDPTPVEVVRILGVPSGTTGQQVNKLTVVFNVEIDEETFSYEDMVLRLQGGDNLMNSSVNITKTDSATYEVNLSPVTTLDGYYVLTINTNTILNLKGSSGSVGKQVSWAQFPNVPAMSKVEGLPHNKIGIPFDTILVTFNMPINIESLTGEQFSFASEDDTISNMITITQKDNEAKVFRIAGLKNLMTDDGPYSLIVNMPNIQSVDSIYGTQQHEIKWTIDQTRPEIVKYTVLTNEGIDEQHVTGIKIEFSDSIKGFDLSDIELWKDGQRQPLSAAKLDSISPYSYQISNFKMLTYFEGNYTIIVHENTIVDFADNVLSHTNTQHDWHVDRTAPLCITNIQITPDLGFSENDGLTSEHSLNILMNVPEACSKVALYEVNNYNQYLLTDSSNVDSGELSLPINISHSGSVNLKACCYDSNNNFSVSEFDFFIDDAYLLGRWLNTPDNPDSICFILNDRILETLIDQNLFSLKRNENEIDLSSVSIDLVNDTFIVLHNIEDLNLANGEYNMIIDLTNLHKYSSGLSGNRVFETTWIVDNNNSNINQTIELVDGWNIISYAVEPDDLSMMAIHAQMRNDGELVKIQNEQGDAIEDLGDPTGWINDIGNMSNSEGYKIKVNSNWSQTVEGIPVVMPYSIDLMSGWNIMGYPLMQSQNALEAFNSLISDGKLVKVQDEQGNAIEDLGTSIGWIDEIGTLDPGKGYKVKVNNNTIITLNYPQKKSSLSIKQQRPKPGHYKCEFNGYGLDHMNVYLLEPTVGGIPLHPDDEIGVFDGDICVGVGVINQTGQPLVSINTSWDDPTTSQKDGFSEGHKISLKLWQSESGTEQGIRQLKVVSGYNNRFEKHQTTIFKVDFDPVEQSYFGDAYPNPSKDMTTFPFSLSEDSHVLLEIYDITGKLVKILINKNMPKGNHSIVWNNSVANGIKVSPGLYFYKITCFDKIPQVKQLVIY